MKSARQIGDRGQYYRPPILANTNPYKALGQYQKHCQVAAIEISSTNYVNYGERIINLIALTVGVIVPQGGNPNSVNLNRDTCRCTFILVDGTRTCPFFPRESESAARSASCFVYFQASFVPRVPYGLAVAAAWMYRPAPFWRYPIVSRQSDQFVGCFAYSQKLPR